MPLQQAAQEPERVRPCSREMEITSQGGLLKAKVVPPNPTYRPVVKRGQVVGFSDEARWRMIQRVATLDWTRARPALFITLTYPDWPRAKIERAVTAQRDKFFLYSERQLGKPFSALWRIEWKPRLTGMHVGEIMPHMHLMVFNVRYMPYWVVNATWKGIIGYKDYVRTETKRMVNDRQAGYYISKYCAKVEDCSLVNAAYLNNPPTGRNWGIHRRDLLPVAAKNDMVLEPGSTMEILRRIARPWFPTVLQSDQSFTLIGKSAELGKKVLKERIWD